MTDNSFYVHLQSLTDFARELETQLFAMTKPVTELTAMAGVGLPLGQFPEADSLATANRAAVEEMRGLLEQVKQAVTFAEDVTRTVAQGYQRTDDALSYAYDSGSAAINSVGGLVGGVVDRVGDTVGGLLGGHHGHSHGGGYEHSQGYGGHDGGHGGGHSHSHGHGRD